ncbi:MAG: hypothetical protein NTV30_09460, partial [Chloroflexi bacterium]|nr:hypothetical protein [Chloroflexota bacterium]
FGRLKSDIILLKSSIKRDIIGHHLYLYLVFNPKVISMANCLKDNITAEKSTRDIISMNDLI